MHVDVEVAVATRRPPGEHATIYCSVSVDLPEHDPTIAGLNAAIDRATTEAKAIACEMAMARTNIVMPVRATVTKICCV